MHKLRNAVKCLVKDLWTPSSNGEQPYEWMVIGMAHALAGACFATLVSLHPLYTSVITTVLYFSIKEMQDIRKGGSIPDSHIDALFVGIGAAYTGVWWWPWAISVMSVCGAIDRYMKRE